jgi:hypothetical protein
VALLAAGSPAAAKCCSLGGASYDFLGDPAMDLGMNGYDQFLSDDYPLKTAAVSDVKEANASRIYLNLSDNSSIFLLLAQDDGRVTGKGNITSGSVTGPVQAVGQIIAEKLSLEMTAPGGELYKFDLAAEGSTVMGDCRQALPDGSLLNETVEGRWES